MNWQRTLLFAIAGLVATAPIQSAEIGQKLSGCSLTTFSKQQRPLDMSQFSGKVLYLDFWASWCPPCAKSFPFLNRLNQQHHEQDLQIIGINLDENLADAEKFLSQFPAEFLVASDLSKQCAEKLGVAAMPSSYLIDRQGVIRHIHLGFRADETGELREKVMQLLAEPVL